MTEQEIVDAGGRIDAFLADPAIVAAFTRLEQKYFTAWREVDRTPAEREKIHSRATALTDLATELRITSDAGKRVTVERQRRGK